MFSSNHILTVTGCLKHSDDLYNALEFGLKSSDWLNGFMKKDRPTKCVYQIVNNTYCIGWHNPNYKLEEGWNEFPFEFDLEIITKIISQFLEKQEFPNIEYWDGSYEKGFVMNHIDDDFNSDEAGIKEPFYGIVQFKPYTCFFAK